MNRSTPATLVAVVASLAGSAPLCAQHYNFKFYGQEEGLQNLAVQSVLQDREGFLWVGTQNGLFRYDGSRFKAFTKADGLPGARIEESVSHETRMARYGSGPELAWRDATAHDLKPCRRAWRMESRGVKRSSPTRKAAYTWPPIAVCSRASRAAR